MSAPRLAVVACLAGALLAGCIAFGEDAPARRWYRLEDRAVVPGPASAARLPLRVLVETAGGAALHDGNALVYGLDDGSRAHYQFAAWVERPSRRIAQLVERRLDARGRFAAVAQASAGVRGDLLLRVSLEELVHDLAGAQGTARVAVVAELVDWRSRTLLGRRVFRADEPVAEPDSGAAAAAIERAVVRALDALAPWVEATAPDR